MRRSPLGVGLLAVMSGAVLAVAPAAANGAAIDEPATTVIYKTEYKPDGTTIRTQVKVAVASLPAPSGTKPDAPPPPTPVKLDPGLAAAVAKDPAASTRQQVIITFQDDVKIPRFPDPDPALPRTGPANSAVQAKANSIVNGLNAQRQQGYQALTNELAPLGVRTLGTYWLLKAMKVEAPLSALPTLVQRSDVAYIEPVETTARPPADSDPANDEEDARALMGTDRFFGMGQNPSYIGILDTGVRATHVMFNNPARPWIREDLTNTSNPNPDDDCWNHGTSTVGILTGNGNLGTELRGVTGITVDSFKVYPSDCGFLNTDAAIKGFQRAVQVGDRVIVAEMQAQENETGGLSKEADNAFDAGAMVIAANGNNGPGTGTVNAPAVAQKALGIGAVDVKTQVTPSYQSLGPAPDGRTKPDLQAPTNVETASNASDTATQVFTGTSAATPHAAGAAALSRDIWRGTGFEVDPGSIYAYLLATGNLATPFNQTNGAGLIKIPAGGWAWTGPQTVSNRQTLEIPFGPIEGTDVGRTASMAIWWPEQASTHNDIDLALVDPNGVTRAQSVSVGGVFERVSFGPLTPGNWKVRITGFSVPSGSQRVNWSGTMTP
jgi:serine protease AprX